MIAMAPDREELVDQLLESGSTPRRRLQYNPYHAVEKPNAVVCCPQDCDSPLSPSNDNVPKIATAIQANGALEQPIWLPGSQLRLQPMLGFPFYGSDGEAKPSGPPSDRRLPPAGLPGLE